MDFRGKISIKIILKMKINRISLNMKSNRICLILFDPLISQKLHQICLQDTRGDVGGQNTPEFMFTKTHIFAC